MIAESTKCCFTAPTASNRIIFIGFIDHHHRFFCYCVQLEMIYAARISYLRLSSVSQRRMRTEYKMFTTDFQMCIQSLSFQNKDSGIICTYIIDIDILDTGINTEFLHSFSPVKESSGHNSVCAKVLSAFLVLSGKII